MRRELVICRLEEQEELANRERHLLSLIMKTKVCNVVYCMSICLENSVVGLNHI